MRREILQAAREVFVKEGYENVSMRKIAGRIEYSPTTIYLYFKDKSDLLSALSEEMFGRLTRVVDKIMAENSDPVERLAKGMRAYVDFGLKNPHDYRVAFMTGDHSRGPDQAPAAWKVFSFVRNTVEQSVAAGRFRPVDIDTASQILWVAVHGITSLLIVHESFPWVDRKRLIDTVIQTAIDGLSA